MRMFTMMALAAFCCTAGMASDLKNGESVAFMGDSITQFGWGPAGYVRMCEAAFKANGLKVKVIPAGISGHKSNNMLARLDKVINRKPTYMTLSCGVNDVWHGARGVKLPDYKKNITKIIDDAQKAGIKVIVLTSTMIGEDANAKNNKILAEYNDFLRQIAKEKGCRLVDLNAEMQKQVAEFRTKTGKKNNFLTVDGVHMDFLGNRMMAQMILKDGFGFTPGEMKKADEAFLKMTHMARLFVPVTGAEYMAISRKADAAKRAPSEYIQDEAKKSLKNLSK